MKFIIFFAVCVVAVSAAGRITPPSTILLPPFLPSASAPLGIKHYPTATIPLAYRNPFGYRVSPFGYRTGSHHITTPLLSYPYSFGSTGLTSPFSSLSLSPYAPFAPLYRSSAPSLYSSFGSVYGGFLTK